MPWPPTLPVAAGGLALVLAAVLALGVTPRWQAEAAQADQTLRQRARAAARPALAPPAPPADRRLEAALPPSDALPQRIRALVQAAQQHGVRIDSVRQSPALRLGQGQAALAAEQVPLRLAGSGSYSSWRRWAAEALQQDDALVLAELQLGRNAPGERVLAGELTWSLLQRPAPEGSASTVSKPPAVAAERATAPTSARTAGMGVSP